jgi:uncharacterized membrane-anchored protein
MDESANYARQYPRFWLAYFVFSVLMFAVNTLYGLTDAFGPNRSPALLGTILGFIGLWPLFGYVRQRRYNPRWLWLVVFWVSAVGTAVAIAICALTLVAKFSLVVLAVAAALLLLGAPYLLALHQYLFRSPHLWQ